MTEMPGPDGIYGPPKPDFSKEKGHSIFAPGLFVALMFCLLFAAAGYVGGRATAPEKSIHELAVEMIQSRHCAPGADWGITASEAEAKAANEQATLYFKDKGLKNVQLGVVPITINGQPVFVVIATWEDCAS